MNRIVLRIIAAALVVAGASLAIWHFRESAPRTKIAPPVADAPSEAQGLIASSELLQVRGQTARATEELSRAVAILREDPSGSRSGALAQALLRLGVNQCRRGRVGEARTSIEEALAIHHRSRAAAASATAECLNGLSAVECVATDFERAIERAREALQAPVTDAALDSDIRLNLGLALMHAGRFDEAEAALASARFFWERRGGLDENPNLADVLHALAEVRRRSGRLDEQTLALAEQAAAIRQRVFADEPEHPDRASSHFLRGRLLLDECDPVAADEQFEMAERIYLSSRNRGNLDGLLLGVCWYFRGECRFRLGDLEEAEAPLIDGFRAIQSRRHWSDPTLGVAGGRVVELLESLGRTDEAADYRRRLEGLLLPDAQNQKPDADE